MLDQLRGGPTVLRIILGGQLRRLRESRGITAQGAARAIRGSESKISRIERGCNAIREVDVADLLKFYGVTDPDEREQLLVLASQANQPGWWHRYNDILPDRFDSYVGLEEAASVIHTYEAQLIPDLLQTEAYACAVLPLNGQFASGDDIERHVELRMARQRLLTAPDAPRLWAVLDEAVLRRPFGGVAVIRQQLEYLIRIAKLPNVALQVMPFGTAAVPVAGGSFRILRFANPDLPDVVYLECLTSTLYLDRAGEVDSYNGTMARLRATAASPDDTIGILDRLRTNPW
jgi:transcriptional regulator with XRE-family HTH domain